MTFRLRPLHLIPPLLLIACLASIYILAQTLAAQMQQANEEQILAQLQQPDGGATAGVDKLHGPAAPATDSSFILRLPHTLDDARDLSLSLSAHLRSHPSSRLTLLLLFACIYLLKQTFSIPGSALLNVMAGFIFGPVSGVPLVALLTATGASGCYALSKVMGGEMLKCSSNIQTRVMKMQQYIDGEKRAGSLFFYLITLRLFPFTPNWLLNLSAPLVGVPFLHFFFSCALGLLPYVYVTVTAGDTLHTLSVRQSARGAPSMSLSDVMDTATVIKLALMALAFLTPTLIKRRMAAQKDAQLKL